jgi:Rhamnan synthesis protein F/Methyltransferase domain
MCPYRIRSAHERVVRRDYPERLSLWYGTTQLLIPKGLPMLVEVKSNVDARVGQVGREAPLLSKGAMRVLSPASFWVPEYLCASAWTEHAPFAFWLVDALRPRRIVELGTHHGFSYFAFCQAVQRLGSDTLTYAIDTWMGDEHAGFYGEAVYNAVQDRNRAHYSGFSTLLRSTFEAALPYFQDGSVDLLHIDGRHFEDVKNVFLQWVPKLAPHAIVLFHDTNVRERGFGVWRVFEELAGKYASFNFAHGNGLGVVATGEITPEALRPLFSAGTEPAVQIRTIYAALGQSLSMRRALAAKTEALGAMLGHGPALSLDHAQALGEMADGDPQVQEMLAALLRAGAQAEEFRTLMVTRMQELEALQEQYEQVAQRLTAIEASTSWKIMLRMQRVLGHAPPGLRVALRRTAKLLWWTATGQVGSPLRARRRLPARAEPLPAEPPQPELPPEESPPIPESARPLNIDFSLKVPLQHVAVPRPADGPVAAIIHMFYPDLAVEFRSYLENIPGAVDLFISTTGEFERSIVEKAFFGWSKGRVDVRLVPNRGRDIAPKLVNFRDVYDSHAYVLHLHTKRSDHASILATWRHLLLEDLLGNEATVSSIFAAFEHNPRLGMVASQHFEPVRPWINWGNNLGRATQLAARMGFDIDPSAALDFPSGSMFWARSAALRPLLDLQLATEDFDEEKGQIDNTLAHAIERLYFFACEKAGFDWIKVARPELFAHNPDIVSVRDGRELDQFFARHVFRLLDPRDVLPRTEPPPGRTGTGVKSIAQYCQRRWIEPVVCVPRVRNLVPPFWRS